MKRLLIAFAAAATTFVASAWNNYSDWFDQSTGSAWAGDYEAVGNAYVIDADVADPVTLTPSVDAPDTNTFTKVAINAKITPADINTYDGLSEENVQTALIAAFDNSVTNYYAWLGGAWVALSGATPNDGNTAVDVTITFDYTLATPRVNFVVGETTLTTNGVEWIELAGVNKRAIERVAFAGSGTVNTVNTDVGIAVAMVEGVKYETFAGALAAATEAGSYVTLLADATTSLASIGDSVQVVENNHTLTVTTTGEIAVSKSVDSETGLATYAAVEGVAMVRNHNTNKDTWYASFADAYDAAALITSGYQPSLTVKVVGDWTPEISISQQFMYLNFTTTSAEDIVINLKNASGACQMSAHAYNFPKNAKLVLADNFTLGNKEYLIGGTLSIPEGVAVTFNENPYVGFDNIDALEGAGTIVIPDRSANGHTWAYWIICNYTSHFPSLLKESSAWHGTLELTGGSDYSDFAISDLGNNNSKVRFNGFSTPLWSSSHGIGGIELVGAGLSITGNVGRTYTITSPITGSGALTVADNTGSLILSGDMSGFTGNVTASGTSSAITFGSSTVGSGQRIVVGGGESVTNAVGATWTAENIIVRGELVANGTVSATTLWGDTGTGIYRANNAAAAISMANSWKGTYIIGWDGGDENSRLTIPSGSTLTGYVDVRADKTKTNNVEFAVNGTLNLNNGYDYSTVVWKKISGSGTVQYAFNPSHWIKEKIILLDDFTGRVEVSAKTQLEIEGVNVSKTPAADSRVVLMTVAPGGTVGTDVPLYVGGNSTGKKLKYNASGASGAGLYLYETHTVTYNLDLEGATNAVGNITSFTALTPAFSLLDAGCDGYTFTGWTNSVGEIVTTIAGGATENVSVYASWTKDEPPAPEVPEIKPGESGSSDCGTAEKADAAAAAINNAPEEYIKAPELAGLSGETAKAYADCFSARAEGMYVVVELNEAGTNALEVASTNTSAQVAASLSTIAATGAATSVDITGAQPGFYYSVVYDDDLSTLDTAGTEGTRALAGANGSVTLAIPAKEQSATAGFYRVKVSVKPSGD